MDVLDNYLMISVILAFVFVSGYLLFYLKFSLLIDINELKTILRELKYRIGIQSAKLLRQLKQKDRLLNKVQRNCDIVTACLQAVSQKRSKCWGRVSSFANCDWNISEAKSINSHCVFWICWEVLNGSIYSRNWELWTTQTASYFFS